MKVIALCLCGWIWAPLASIDDCIKFGLCLCGLMWMYVYIGGWGEMEEICVFGYLFGWTWSDHITGFCEFQQRNFVRRNYFSLFAFAGIWNGFPFFGNVMRNELHLNVHLIQMGCFLPSCFLPTIGMRSTPIWYTLMIAMLHTMHFSHCLKIHPLSCNLNMVHLWLGPSIWP